MDLSTHRRMGAFMYLLFAWAKTEGIFKMLSHFVEARTAKILAKRHNCVVPLSPTQIRCSWKPLVIERTSLTPFVDFRISWNINFEVFRKPVEFVVVQASEIRKSSGHAVNVVFNLRTSTFVIVDGTYLFKRLFGHDWNYSRRFSALGAKITSSLAEHGFRFRMDPSQMQLEGLSGGEHTVENLRKFGGVCTVLAGFATDAVMCANGNIHAALTFMRRRVDEVGHSDLNALTRRFFAKMTPYWRCDIIDSAVVLGRRPILCGIRPTVGELDSIGTIYLDYSKLDPFRPYDREFLYDTSQRAERIHELEFSRAIHDIEARESGKIVAVFGFISLEGYFRALVSKTFRRGSRVEFPTPHGFSWSHHINVIYARVVLE